jgi:arylsulfatase A-like enzyme
MSSQPPHKRSNRPTTTGERSNAMSWPPYLERSQGVLPVEQGGYSKRERASNRSFGARYFQSTTLQFRDAGISASLGLLIGSTVGLVLALSDFGAMWLWLPLWRDRFSFFIRLIVTHVPLSAILGLVFGLVGYITYPLAKITVRRIARDDERRFHGLHPGLTASLFTFLLSPLVVWVALLLFTGGKTSKLPRRELLEVITAVILLGGVWALFFFAQRLFRFFQTSTTTVATIGCVGLFGLFFSLSKIDQYVLPTQYPYLHTVLSVGCWFVSFYTLSILASRFIVLTRVESKLPLIGLLTALCLGAVLFWNVLTLEENQNVRVAMLDPRASHCRSIMRSIQPILFRATEKDRNALATAAARKARALRQQHNAILGLPTLPNAHIFLISIDALRADHLGTYGYSRPTSPYLDEQAKSSIVFERAYSQAPHSSYSISSIMTSEYLHETVALGNPLPQETVATALTDSNYYTAAFYTLGIFHTEGDRLKEYEDNAYGFALHNHTDEGSEETTDRVIQEIDRTVSRGEPKSFFWVHYFDAHEPYLATTFGESDVDRYDSEILEVDGAIKRLMTEARQRLKRDIVFCITADHGEEFHEHGGVYHGSSLYEEQIRVPLIFNIPGFPAKRIRTPVELVDIAPTLLSLADVDVPPSMRGDDLRSIMLGKANMVGPAFSAVIHKRMVVSWPYKLIADLRFNLYELYDLNNDRFERRNLADSNRFALESLRGEIYAWLDSLSPTSKKENDVRIAAINRGRLGDRRAVKPLSEILLDDHASTDNRIQAARILGILADSNSTPSLLKALENDEALIAAEAAIALGRMSDTRAIPLLRQLVSSEDIDIRSRAAVSLGRLHDKAAVPGLIDALWVAPNEYEQQEAIRWLGRLRDSRGLDPLIKILPEARNRYLVVISMGYIGDKRAFEPLADVLSWDTHPNVRDNVIRGLGQLGDSRAVDLILPIAEMDPTLKNSSESLVRLNAIGLKAMGGTDVTRDRVVYGGFRQCVAGPLFHDWDYLHRTWCETSRETAWLRLEVPKSVAHAPYGSIAVLGIKRTDSARASRIRLSIGKTDLEPVQVDGTWQEYRWKVKAGALSSGFAKARIKGDEVGARFAVDHLLLMPLDHVEGQQHDG